MIRRKVEEHIDGTGVCIGLPGRCLHNLLNLQFTDCEGMDLFQSEVYHLLTFRNCTAIDSLQKFLYCCSFC